MKSMSGSGDMAVVEGERYGKDHPGAVENDERSSLSSHDDAQIGVKNIEAISQTWTTWSITSAYIGYVLILNLRANKILRCHSLHNRHFLQLAIAQTNHSQTGFTC